MAIKDEFTTCFEWDETEFGTKYYSQSRHSKRVDTGTRVSGGFITLPDGSKFRRATSITRKTYGWTGVAGQAKLAKHNSNPRNFYTGPGGENPHILMGANCPVITVGSGSPDKLYASATIPQSMRNEAVTKALLDIADQKANIGENLATFRQTVGLIRNPVGALCASLKKAWDNRALRPFLGTSVKQARAARGAKRIPENIASVYLQYVYGWIPLMSDIHGIMEMMKGSANRPLLLHGRGVSYQQAQSPVSSRYYFSEKTRINLGPMEVRGKVKCNLWGRIDPNHTTLRTINQLGLLNPLSLAYDLTPWSFVVDWFVPVGNVLAAMSAPAGLTFVDGSVSGRWSMNGPYEEDRDRFTVTSVQSNVLATGIANHESWRRDSLSNWPLPGLWINSNPFAGDRPLKALALAVTNLRRLKI